MTEAKKTPDVAVTRPSVAHPVKSRSVWIFAGLLGCGAVALFAALESRRAAISEPTLGPTLGLDDGGSTFSGGSGPPPLALPQYQYPPALPYVLPRATEPVAVPVARRQPPLQPIYQQPPSPPPTPMISEPPPKVDYGRTPYNVGAPTPAAGAPNANSERVLATRFANPSNTVPKGTVIMAVLESAIDSTRPGMARAMISRDVRGFDGTLVLIPRGSRLTGEYKSDVGPGQKRALIQWQRLIRPDGAIINLDSPVADPQGRTGVEGKVNSHFWARFGGTLLQSGVNIGNQVAINNLSRSMGTYGIPVLGGYPQVGAGAGVIPQITTTTPPPTLTVKPGTSISVFTARDLDFSLVDSVP